jgi:hypothetical protein
MHKRKNRMENICLMYYTLSLSLFCNSSEHITNKPHQQVKSLMEEYHNSFKPQLETENKMQGDLAKDVVNKQERKFGRGSSGAEEGKLVSKL